LLELALERISSMDRENSLILEIGTGCGALAICMAREKKGMVRIVATDISTGALQIARENASMHGCEGYISFVKADLFPPLKGPEVDLIVCNPPYIPSSHIPALDPEIKDYEPRWAIDGGPDGLDQIRRIIALSPFFLKPKGELLMEIGFDQAERVVRIIEENGCFDETTISHDLSGKERIVWARMGSGNARIHGG